MTGIPEGGQLQSLEQVRERAIDTLSEHFAHDRLSLDELERRLELAYRAGSIAEIRALVSDLEAPPNPATARSNLPAPVVPDHERIVSIMSENERRGMWAVPQRLDVVAVMSDTTIDLTQATLPSGIIDIKVRSLMASVKIIVPPGVRVANRVSAFMSAVNVRPDDAATSPDLPVIRLTGWAMMTEIVTKTRRVEGEETV